MSTNLIELTNAEMNEITGGDLADKLNAIHHYYLGAKALVVSHGAWTGETANEFAVGHGLWNK